MGYVIADYNRKGGIGKTNSLINIAAQLAMNGKKVIVIDGDSQMNLTQFLFAEDESVYEDGLLKSEVDTLYEVLEQVESTIRLYINRFPAGSQPAYNALFSSL